LIKGLIMKNESKDGVYIDNELIEAIRERATRMWIDETRPASIPASSANVYFIVKAFCEVFGFELLHKLDRKSTEVVDDVN